MQSVGERLKQARVAAGLSLRELAARVEVSAMAISKYENDRMAPSSEVLLRLAHTLGVKLDYFFRPVQVDVRRPAFRKHSRLTGRAQGMIEGHIREFLERYLAAEAVFGPGGLPAFEWPSSCQGTLQYAACAEAWADGLRESWGLGNGPIASLCEALEDHGAKVILLNGLGEGFDGYSCWANDDIPVLASRAGDVPGDRQRFTLAHELGHLLLEGRVAARVDLEKACHRFAGAFLVPSDAARREVGGRRDRIEFGELHALKHKWGLSMSAWMHRLRDLGIISEGHYRASMQTFRVNGWHRLEPGDPVPAERTTRFERLVQRAVAEDIISVSRAADFLNTPLIEVRRQMGWPTQAVAAP